jgi:uncharacterized metal-binding protein
MAAVELTKQGVGTIHCLAGIGARIPSGLKAARLAERLLVIDGCSLACAREIVEAAGLRITDYIDIAAEGIDKNHDFDLQPRDIALIVKRARELLANVVGEPRFSELNSSCGCECDAVCDC